MINLDNAIERFGQEFVNEELTQKFLTRLQAHVYLVNKYAAKIDKHYPLHDQSKVDLLLTGYRLYSKPKQERTEEEQEALDLATLIHIKASSHHPEYWSDTNLTGFTRSNYTPNGPIDATSMSESALQEMCCDWCACSEEFGTNTPFEWFDRVNGTRWLFTPEQQMYIKLTLEKLWNE